LTVPKGIGVEVEFDLFNADSASAMEHQRRRVPQGRVAIVGDGDPTIRPVAEVF